MCVCVCVSVMVPALSGLDPLVLRFTWKVIGEHHNQKLILWQFNSGYILCWKCEQALFYICKHGRVWHKLPWWSKHSVHQDVYVWCYNFRIRYCSSWNLWHIPSSVLHVETWLTFDSAAVNTSRTGSFKLFKRPFLGFLTILTL